MKTPIDLTESNEMKMPMGGGSGGPTVHICTEEKLDFPDEGILTVRFKVRRREEDVEDERCTEVLELLEILKVKATSVEAPAKKYDDASQAMDKLRAEMEAEDEDE